VTSLDYAEPAERMYRRLRTHPWLADAALALLLMAVSAVLTPGLSTRPGGR